jgi:hypothetical protein
MSMTRSAVVSASGRIAPACVVDQGIHTAPDIDRLGDCALAIFGASGIRNQASDVGMLGNRFFDGAGTAAGNEQHLAQMASAKHHYNRGIPCGSSRSTVLRMRFAWVNAETSGGLECRSNAADKYL